MDRTEQRVKVFLLHVHVGLQRQTPVSRQRYRSLGDHGQLIHAWLAKAWLVPTNKPVLNFRLIDSRMAVLLSCHYVDTNAYKVHTEIEAHMFIISVSISGWLFRRLCFAACPVLETR